IASHVDLPRRVQVNQTYRFVSALSSQSVPGYHTLDARVAWRASERIELSLTGQNLLQPHHPEFNAVGAEIRRSAYVAVTWTR
nr:TonB-dependent receptor [Acidobacteriota bacterium]